MKKPIHIYLIPDFQNPAGMTMPEAKESKFLNIAAKKTREIMIIEDSPTVNYVFPGKPQRMLVCTIWIIIIERQRDCQS